MSNRITPLGVPLSSCGHVRLTVLGHIQMMNQFLEVSFSPYNQEKFKPINQFASKFLDAKLVELKTKASLN